MKDATIHANKKFPARHKPDRVKGKHNVQMRNFRVHIAEPDFSVCKFSDFYMPQQVAEGTEDAWKKGTHFAFF